MATDTSQNSPDRVELLSRSPHISLQPICSSRFHTVTFHHPAYDSTRLLDVPAFDNPRGGIHHGTALLICGIIAGNVWDGWLTETKNGERLDLDTEALLMGTNYYFHVPGPESRDGEDQERQMPVPYRYPIIPSFQQWSFPHNKPPPGWSFVPDSSDVTPSLFPAPSASNVSQAVRDRDSSCRVSGYRDGMERAHLCPRSEAEWFTKQEMDRYNTKQSLTGAGIVDDMANALALRADIHAAFDAGIFIFTRKQQSWISHFLEPTFNLGPEYHNVYVEMPPMVHPVFLLARFAWAVFPRIGNFLTRGENRLVKLRKESSSTEEVMELGGEALRSILGNSARGRSNSPKKRQRGENNSHGVAEAGTAFYNRPRLYIDDPTQSIEMAGSAATTPELLGADCTSNCSQPRLSDGESLTSDEERKYIAALRKQALRAQRDVPVDLICCDYNAAEKAIEAGVEGPRKFGGAHLCISCLGAEIMPEEP